SLPAWNRSLGLQGTVHVGRTRYLAGSDRPPQSELDLVLLLLDASPYDRAQARVMTIGAGGLVVAILIAGLVSTLVSHSVSQPVERLVDATHRVASGDYSVQVGVAGRDEIGR